MNKDKMLITFKGYVSYGKLDSVEYDVDVLISEEDYERLKVSAKNHMRMAEDSAISDIYEKVYQAALNLDVEVLREDEEMLADKMAWYLDLTPEEAAEREYSDEEIEEMFEAEGARSVGYPSEIEEALRYKDDDED